MVATVVNGLTNITLANNNTGFTVWKRDGTGGTPSAISETDVFIQGTGSCSVKVSNQGVALAYGTSGLNLSATNTHLYIWCNMLAGGLMKVRDSTSEPGLAIIVSSDATLSTGSNYKMWAVDGSDTYPGGWVRYVIDLSKTATISTGTLNLSSVQHVGMYCNTRPNTAKFDNMAIDRIDYTTGAGLRVYGTSTTDDTFGDILTADEGTVNNKYGIVTSKEGIIYCRGRIELGDDVSTNAATLTDVDKVVVWEDPRYYDGTADASCVSSTLYRLDVVGNATGATSVTLGKKVGTGDTASGRNGMLFVSAGPNVDVDFDDGNVNTMKLYGSELRGIIGTIAWGTNTAHECIGVTFNGCNQFDPVGGIIMRDVKFVSVWDDGTADASNRSALLWNSSIDIKNCQFLANSHSSSDVAHGIEHDTIPGAATGTATTANGAGTTLIDSAASFLTTAAVNDVVFNETDGSWGVVSSVDSNTQLTHSTLTTGTENDWDVSDAYSVVTPVTYTDLVFSGNEKDVHNSTSDGLAISKVGTSNPSTSTGTVAIQGSVTVSFKAVDSNNTAIQGVRVTAYLQSDNTEILNTTTNASGIASTSYSGSTPATIYYRYRKASPGDTKYINLSGLATIESGTGVSVQRDMKVDTNNNA